MLLIFARVPWQQKADSLINPPLMQQAESILRFDKSTLDIGTLTEDDAPQACRFTGRNISKEAVTVTKVRTTCGCTVAELPAGEILPGETATIVLTYHPKNHPGTIDTDAFVYLSCSEKHPVARLTLTGNVLPGADEWARLPVCNGQTETETEPDGISGSDARKATFRTDSMRKQRRQAAAPVGTRHPEVRNFPDRAGSNTTGQ